MLAGYSPPSSRTPRSQTPDVAWALEKAVHAWLEGLRHEHNRAILPENLRKAVEQVILPALAEGDVASAGPRLRRTGTD